MIEHKLRLIREQLGDKVQLVAVSKYHSQADILQVYNAGHKVFGESKIQDMTQKYQNLPKDISWHMIGHTQTNKVKYMAPYVSLIHSVDSLKLLSEIDYQAKKNNRIIDFLFQIKIAQEQTKYGLQKQELWNIISSEIFLQMKNVRLRGLMGMATNTDNPLLVKEEFLYLKSVFDQLKQMQVPNNQIDILSMGMSADYQLAISCGSTMVRIGSALFE